MFQNTLAKSVEYSGIGLHSGKEVGLKLQPASADSGIRFFIHEEHAVHVISPSPYVVSTTELATTLSDGVCSVSTVEHLLAALSGMNIDNVDCHVYNGYEIPIMDGSALDAVRLIQKAGIRRQRKLRRTARITGAFTYEDSSKSIAAYPYNGFRVEYSISFAHSSIGKQHFSLDITPETFSEIADSRTFGFLKEVEYLHAKNLALGGSLSNAIVLDEEGIVNPDGLRHPDEFVRHKILDFVGDMAMFGVKLQGRFVVSCSGHKHNNEFLRALLARGSNCFVISTEEDHSTESCHISFPVLRPAAAII